jgi:predicted phage gp36 major capsid-like protein
VTLEMDVEARIKEEMRRTGKSFKETVNRLLRRGAKAVAEQKDEPFQFITKDMGQRPGLNYDSIHDLLEHAEGPDYK